MSEDWFESTLGAVAVVSRVRTDPRTMGNQVLTHYSIPALDESGKPVVEAAEGIASHKFRVEQDSVLVSLLNPRIPRVWFAPGARDAVCSTEFAVLSPSSSRVSIHYLHLLCQSDAFWTALQKRAVGTTGSRQRAKAEGLLSIPVAVPPHSQQSRIVDLIEYFDHQIENHLAEEAAAEVLLSRLREELMIPSADWTTSVLGGVATLRMGRTPSRSNSAYWTSKTDHPFVTIADMTGWRVGASREGVSDAAVKEGKAKGFPRGSLLMSFKLSIGRVGITDREVFPNEAIVCIDPMDHVDREFLAHWLLTQDLASGTVRAVKGATLNSTSLAAIPVSYPDRATQARIVSLVESARHLAEDLSYEHARILELRRTLLTEFLLGERTVPPDYDRLYLRASS